MIVNDASCLIDLHKGRLLQAMLSLLYRFIVPYPVRKSELLRITQEEWRLLDQGGLVTYDLPPDAIGDVAQIREGRARLSANDCICLDTAMRHEGAILLTGDQQLRRAAGEMGVETHGVLWLHDQLREAGQTPLDHLRSALETWCNDPAVFLPADEIELRLRGLRRLMR